ncbi:protein FAR1-RELATED SEQUENCE 5-like [Asparagus officinalis]|uniref:protein FAR1-RELATED SEQUENCE 5-like n=1 Tax=Asparagus officinalis TaxID=4686 RepID=UPI00098E813A|nr:protein FAR1-RELATED SEQUENCE 5-like [Asparagus officinalis]
MEYKDIILNSYTTENEWYEFYNSYANLKGFSIRRDKVRYDKNGNLYYRKFVCFKEGIRETKHMDRADRTYKERLRDMHNHELAGPDEVPFLRSQQRVDDVQMEEIHMLAQCGIPKNKIMDFMEYRDGGYEKVGFIRKDIYNKWGKISRRIIEHGDAQTILNMMEQRKRKDVYFFYLNKTDDEGHLTHLFWADSQSRVDYEAFGDVLLFDSTYQTNKYAMPFIPFIGLNHHRRTIIFGCGVVCNETTASYIWLLKAFKMAMCQKEPLSVITDGDSAMRKAIITEFPDVKHQLCSWHIGKKLI